jgi:hypothetical protein
MNLRYGLVAQRAAHRCEYCRAPEAVFNFPFVVEHIIPSLHGGADDESNWALSCRSCNLHKGAEVDGIDPQTARTVAIFHPRLHRWEEHFAVDEATGQVDGLTAIGRVTIARLRLNGPAQLSARKEWERLRLFPMS